MAARGDKHPSKNGHQIFLNFQECRSALDVHCFAANKISEISKGSFIDVIAFKSMVIMKLVGLANWMHGLAVAMTVAGSELARRGEGVGVFGQHAGQAGEDIGEA